MKGSQYFLIIFLIIVLVVSAGILLFSSSTTHVTTTTSSTTTIGIGTTTIPSTTTVYDMNILKCMYEGGQCRPNCESAVTGSMSGDFLQNIIDWFYNLFTGKSSAMKGSFIGGDSASQEIGSYPYYCTPQLPKCCKSAVTTSTTSTTTTAGPTTSTTSTSTTAGPTSTTTTTIPYWVKSDSLAPPHGNIVWDGRLDGGVFVDLNHDGFADYIFMKSGSIWNSTDNSTSFWSDRRAYINYGGAWVQDDTWLPPFGNIVYNKIYDGGVFVDLNGDGYQDYVFMNSGPTWSNRTVYINTKQAGIPPHWAKNDSWLPPFGNIVYNGVYDGGLFTDLNGDKLPDYVFMNSGPTWSNRTTYINTGSGWVRDDSWVSPLYGNIVYNGLPDGGRFVDLNGDGLSDYIFMSAGPTLTAKIAYINKGSGSNPHWVQNDSWLLPFGNIVYDRKDDGARFVDLNGDGYQDYVFMNSGPTWSNRRVYINAGKSSSQHWIQNDSWVPPFGNIVWNSGDDGSRFADINGDGYQDYVFMNSGPTWSNRTVYINEMKSR